MQFRDYYVAQTCVKPCLIEWTLPGIKAMEKAHVIVNVRTIKHRHQLWFYSNLYRTITAARFMLSTRGSNFSFPARYLIIFVFCVNVITFVCYEVIIRVLCGSPRTDAQEDPTSYADACSDPHRGVYTRASGARIDSSGDRRSGTTSYTSVRFFYLLRHSFAARVTRMFRISTCFRAWSYISSLVSILLSFLAYKRRSIRASFWKLLATTFFYSDAAKKRATRDISWLPTDNWRRGWRDM